MPRYTVSALIIGLAAGCEAEKDKAPDPVEVESLEPVCAAPVVDAAVTWADANHDGVVDVSDGVWGMRYLLSGGPAPACAEALNLLSDDLVDIGDVLGVPYHLFVGNMALPSKDLDCDAVEAIADAPCARFGLSLNASSKVEASAGESLTFESAVWLKSPDLAVQAWSFGVAAEGCTITASVAEGTASADTRLDEQGRRDMGFTRSDVVTGGLTNGTMLSWERDVSLEAREEAWPLLRFTVSATAPASGCDTCTLTLTDALRGPGEPVALVLSAGGRSYRPTLTGATVEICAR